MPARCVELILLLAVLALAVSLVRCDERRACSDVSDCEPGRSCLYVHADDGLRCVQLCDADSACPAGQKCRLGASTCAGCADLLSFCQ